MARIGSGPPLVLLHGYPDNLQVWSAVAPQLSRSFEVIALDWPGMGESEAWPGGASPFHMAERLVALLDAWQLKDAHLVAADMGGQAALACAAKFSSRVASVVVMNSLVLWDEKTSWEIALLRRFGWNRWLLRHAPRVIFQRALRTFLSRGEHLDAEIRADFWRCFRQRSVREFVIRMCAGYQGTLPLLARLYSDINAPTLVLWAENDKHFPVAHATRLCTAIRESRLEIVPSAEHWMMLSQADEVADRIKRFVTECMAAQADHPRV